MESIRLFVNAYVAVDGEPFYNNIRMSKHTDLIDECIMYYIYTYHLRCPKQDVLRTLIKVFYMFATEAGIHPCMLCF